MSIPESLRSFLFVFSVEQGSLAALGLTKHSPPPPSSSDSLLAFHHTCQAVFVALCVLSGATWDEAIAAVRLHPPTRRGLRFEEGHHGGLMTLVMAYARLSDVENRGRFARA